MRHQQTVAFSLAEIFSKIIDFLAVGGWAVHHNAPEGLGHRAHLSKNGLFVNLRLADAEPIFTGASGIFTGLGLNISTGYSAAAAWHSQPGAPTGVTSASVETVATPIVLNAEGHVLYLSENDDGVAVVLRVRADLFQYIAFGSSINKVGSWVGGAYCLGRAQGDSYSHNINPVTITQRITPLTTVGSLLVRADVDGARWGRLGAATGAAGVALASWGGAATTFPTVERMAGRGVSALSTEANLIPMQLLVARAGGGHSMLGGLGTLMCFTGASSRGYAVGSTYNRGAERYLIFPGFALRTQ